MKKWLLYFMLLLSACGEHGSRSADNTLMQDNATAQATHTPIKRLPTEDMDVDSITISRMPWIDSLMDVYLERTDDEIIRSSINAKHSISWLYDKMYGTDSAFYIVLHLGHDMEDHFATDGWIYIDTVTRSIYVYDLPNDRHYKWELN